MLVYRTLENPTIQDHDGTLDDPIYDLTPIPNKPSSTRHQKQNTAARNVNNTTTSEKRYDIVGDAINSDQKEEEKKHNVIRRHSPAYHNDAIYHILDEEVENIDGSLGQSMLKGVLLAGVAPLISITKDEYIKPEHY